MHHIFKISLVACLLVLGIAQAQAVTYTPARTRPIYQQALTGEMYTTSSSSMPTTVSFHSTSAYSTDKWIQPITPILNADGSMVAEAAILSQRRSNGAPDPDDDDDDEYNGPVGDAVLPLLLMAAAFCLLRKREII